MTDDLRSALASLVAAAARPAVDPASVTEDTALILGGLALDSLSILELVVGLESLGIGISAADVNLAHIGTFGQLLAYVRARRG